MTKAPSPKTIAAKIEKETTPAEPNQVLEERAVLNINKVISNTGKNVEDVNSLILETRDQLLTEAVARKFAEDRKLETLDLERLDHQRTLALALGIGNEDNTEELVKNAKERVESLQNKARDKSKDAQAEQRPANWRITRNDDGTIEAVNLVTGREFSGEAKDLFA